MGRPPRGLDLLRRFHPPPAPGLSPARRLDQRRPLCPPILLPLPPNLCLTLLLLPQLCLQTLPSLHLLDRRRWLGQQLFCRQGAASSKCPAPRGRMFPGPQRYLRGLSPHGRNPTTAQLATVPEIFRGAVLARCVTYLSRSHLQWQPLTAGGCSPNLRVPGIRGWLIY